ncbi:MAG: uroporphyrinogen-III C-methyltransferase [Armatimonadota bacterium]
MAGKVYLVGAGPGDPELLTLKGKRALEQADVVVYDRLANPRLLEHARPDAERVYVGKESQRHPVPQPDITALVVERARAGLTVCRLKGGDPFIFGRGGEEAEALAAAGIEWEYVPGVTSAVAVPGYAGIPVTYRGLCATFAVVTAHEDPTKGPSTIRWEQLAGSADTMLFMMGAERLPLIVENLLRHGRAPETPAAVVSQGSHPTQRVISGTLGTLLERCRAVNSELSELAPAVVVVGEVARLRERLRWWDNRPLFGKRIVVTRPREQAEGLVEVLAQEGAEPILCPTIRIQPIPDPDLRGLDRGYDWVVFTSVNGVYSVANALRVAGGDIRRLGSARIAAIGPGTAHAAEAAGLRVDFIPSRFVAEQVAEEFPEPVAGLRVLIPRAREAREVLPEVWRSQGAEVDVVPVYESVSDSSGFAELRQRLAEGGVDAVTFTASSTVRNFAREIAPSELGRAAVVCIGPITAEAARAHRFPVDAVAEPYTIPGLVATLRRLFLGNE